VRRLLLLLILVTFLVPSRALCEEGGEPVVDVKPPESYHLKKIALFPLELPVYVFKGALWPITEGVGYLERKHVFDRAADFLSNEEKTFWVYPIVNWGGGDNFGGGVGFKDIDLFNDKYVLNAEYTINIALNQFAKLSLAKNDAFRLWDRSMSFWTGVEFDRTLNADYYGRGGNSVQGNRSRYTINDIDWDGQLFYDLGWNVNLRGSVGIATARTGPSTKGGYPAVDTTFGAANLPGFEMWLTYLRLGLGVIHDTRDSRMRPQRGGQRMLKFYRFQCLGDNDFSFNEYSLDVEQYFPLWKPGLVFHVRTNWIFQQEVGSERVPFYRLDLLDYKAPLRGFKRGRFRDKSSALFNFEYLFPLSRMVGGIFFVDTGRVFNGVKNFSFSNWKYSVGWGLDLHLFRVTLLKFRMAYGGEGINLILGMSRDL